MLDVKATLAKLVGFLASGGTMYGSVSIKNKNADRDGTAPSSDKTQQIIFRDKDNEALGGLRGVQLTDGRTGIQLGAYGEKNGSQVNNLVGIYIKSNGDPYFVVNNKTEACDALGIGTVVSNDVSSNVACASGSYQAIASVALTAGTWVLSGGVSFASNATGIRTVGISNSSTALSGAYARATAVSVPALSGQNTWVHTTHIFTATSSTTLYLVAKQDSGASRNATGFLRAVKVSS